MLYVVSAFLLSFFPLFSTPHSNKEVWIIIHGTFAKNGDWFRPDGDFYETLKNHLPPYARIEYFLWSGANTHAARQEAGLALAAEIFSEYGPEEYLNFIGHSHGCNVGMLALKKLHAVDPRYKIKQFITLAPPICIPTYAPPLEAVEVVYNLFSYGDQIQSVLQSFKRVYDPHPKIWNIQITLNGQCPGHQALHAPEVAACLPTLKKYVKKNDETVLHLSSKHLPRSEHDTDRLLNLKQDFQFTEGLIMNLGLERKAPHGSRSH